ncbi:MAG: hypothetical protein GXP49_16410 [Deltaproteobacteria bacterium]|nr:hypothetical protein [Deltaproteobacteria bacterium]
MLNVPDNPWLEIQVESTSNDAGKNVPSMQDVTVYYDGKPEQCDGMDNDCNGDVDESDLCPGGSVCAACRCAEPCIFGECSNGK